MQKYIVRGAMRDTGKSVKAVVNAVDQQDAATQANQRGVLVESVTLDTSPTQIVVAQRKHSTPAASTSPPPLPPVMVQRQPWTNFVGTGQDPAVVERLYGQMLGVMTAQETLQIMVVQKKPLVNVSPDALAATDRRVIYYRTKMLGRMMMDDFVWSKLSDAKLSEGFMGATITFSVIGVGYVTVDHLPKEQARAFYRYAQQQEESAVQTRRQYSLEESRAAAGGVTVQNLTQPFMNAAPTPVAPPTQDADPAARLRSLKGLLDSGLISQSEFDGKRADILKAI